MATSFYVLALTVACLIGFAIWFAKNKVISFGIYRWTVWCLLALSACLMVWVFALVLLS